MKNMLLYFLITFVTWVIICLFIFYNVGVNKSEEKTAWEYVELPIVMNCNFGSTEGVLSFKLRISDNKVTGFQNIILKRKDSPVPYLLTENLNGLICYRVERTEITVIDQIYKEYLDYKVGREQ